MDNGTKLFVSLLITLFLGIIIQVALYQNRKKQKEEYPGLWKQFELVKKQKSHNEMIEIGNKLIYNKYIPTQHLRIIQKTAEELESKIPEFKELRINAYDKWIHQTKGQGHGY